MSKPIRFERQYLDKYKCTVVALDCKLSDFNGEPIMVDGKMMVKLPEKTVKDCRYLDGCFYIHLGRVPETTMNSLIELYQKAANSEKWTEGDGQIVPDDELDLGL